MKSKLCAALTLVFLSTLNSRLSTCFAQGALTPPGAPAPTMKTLDQIEPRTPISSLPFTITNAGSFYVTGNLTGIAVSNGITISASDVTLDLGGFALVGLTNSGDGIQVSGARTNVAIRNGTVRGWGVDGINALAANNGLYQDLRLSDNLGWGLSCGPNGTVNNCTALLNGRGLSSTRGGFFIGTGCTVVNCTAQGHVYGISGLGFSSFDGCTFSGCTANNNRNGFSISSGSTIVGCTALGNQYGNGISPGDGCTISGCTARSSGGVGIAAGTACTVSGCTTSANVSDGISFVSSCRVVDNTCAGNGGTGINATSSRNRIDSNTVMGNTGAGIKCNPRSEEHTSEL